MSTNYYVAGYTEEDEFDPTVHIGKTYYGGVARGMGFIWAMEMGRLEGVTEIVNEYGETFDRAAFTKLLQRCTHQRFESVGTEFC